MSGRPKRAAANKDKEEEKIPYSLKWSNVEEYFYVLDSEEIKPSTKIAAFDMDSTLIETKGTAKFPTGRSDWKWWHKSVPEKLKSLRAEGFKIMIFTNQGGIEKKKQNKSDLTGKIIDLCSELGFPIQAYMAGSEDQFRKPHTSMWDYMVEKRNGGLVPDLKVSFYCGDAAGRQAGWKSGKKKDFSVGDRQFAANVGCIFYTPEELFLEEAPVDFQWGALDPKSIIASAKGKEFDEEGLTSEKQELIIMVGRPASGKSTLVRKYLLPAGYIHVNRDTLGTAAKCKKAVTEALKEGASVVVDNTNPSVSARAEFLNIAADKDVPARCFWMKTDQDTASHLNYVRVRETQGAVRRIPDVGYRMFNKNFEDPELSEGFTEIREIEFIPDLRDDEKFKKMFLGWTPEGI